MSYIAFDLDALNVARDVGNAAGIPEERVTHGLLRMWAWCFREKTDAVDGTLVRGFFGVDVAPALVAFGFLADASGKYRVRGAERYLRVTEQRQKAGKARSLSAGRSAGRFTSGAPADHQQTTSGTPADHQLLHRAPSTEHRTPNTVKSMRAPPAPDPEKKTSKAKVDRPTDARHAPLRARLCEIFQSLRGSAYPFGPRDAAAVRDLLAAEEPDVIAGAWVRGLQSRGFPLVSTLPELHRNLAHFVGSGPPLSGKEPFNPNGGIMRGSAVVYPDKVAADAAAFDARQRDQDPFPWSGR